VPKVLQQHPAPRRITRIEVLTGIIVMWLTEKGISLVVLIIAITLTSLLGVGIVSFMGAKQKTLVPQAQTYQAYAIAHAGTEFAIRYAYDNKDDNDFPNSHFPKTVSFGGGSFTITYDSTNNLVRSVGIYETASRTIELTNFRSYANIP
jgi:hypothetical protein